MADPFLLAHAVRPLCFDIGGRLTPISIRDQMVRGRMIVDRAIEAGLIDGFSRPFLVAGAGAAGATAAIYAASRGVPTLLIDSGLAPFGRQATCNTRWIDPLQYDWPETHWDTGRYPITAPSMPLSWAANRSHIVASRWARQFMSALTGYPHLKFWRGASLGAPHLVALGGAIGPMISVPVTVAGRAVSVSAGMLLTCFGFGTEKCTVGMFSGNRFWDNDKLEDVNLGLPTSHSNPTVLISGGGDGSLQDFLRTLTGMRSARSILETIISSLSPSQKEQFKLYVERVYSAEDQASRSYIWGNSVKHDHYVHSALNAELTAAVADIFSNSTLGPEVTSALTTILMPYDVTLVYRCSHFSQSYSLNRFLVLAIKAYCDKHGVSTVHFEQDSEVSVVHSVAPHRCGSNAAACYGQGHEVEVISAGCLPPVPTASRLLPKKYDVVIIRHGVVPPPLLAGSASLPFPRQVLPYHVT